MNLTEETKITLTINQIRRLVMEAQLARLNNEDGGFTEQELLQSLITPDGDVDESIRSMLALSMIASLFAVGNIVQADDIRANVSRANTPQQVQQAINQASKKTYGGFSAAQATNAVLRTIYLEGKGESSTGRQMIATVIWNRAGGDVDKLVQVCLKKSQFSIWNGLSSSQRKPSGFTIKIPSSVTKNPNNKAIWEECKGLVEAMFNGTFVPSGHYNAYMNKDTADKSAVDTWGTTMSDQKKIGHHTFGYLREQDGFRKNKPQPTSQYASTYKVKRGDLGVSYIARNLINSRQTKYTNVNALTNDIIKINSFKTDRKGNPIIRVGDEIKLPS